MALAEVWFWAGALGKQTAMNVIIPESPGPWAVFYLLHGLSDDYSIWLRRTCIERYVAGLKLMVVMPDTGRGWYTNAKATPWMKYEDHIIQDVVGFIDRTFPTNATRAGRVIGGLSMGGYGAVKLALKYPQMFCAATSHSGALLGPLERPEDRPKEIAPNVAEFEAVFGTAYLGGEDDPVALASKCPRDQRPALRIDCGTSDFLLNQNRKFHAHLESLGYTHEYEEFPGGHEWAYWDLQVREAVGFHRRVLEEAGGGGGGR